MPGSPVNPGRKSRQERNGNHEKDCDVGRCRGGSGSGRGRPGGGGRSQAPQQGSRWRDGVRAGLREDRARRHRQVPCPRTRATTRNPSRACSPRAPTPFVGKNNEDIAVKFEQEGVYGIKCLPHYGMGMVAMIVVGNARQRRSGQGRSAGRKGKAGLCDAVRQARGQQDRIQIAVLAPASPVGRMDEQRLVHPDSTGRRTAPARETQRLDPAAQAWPSSSAIGGKRDRKPVARISDHSAAEATGAY